jgi:hypothetical protein
MPKAVLNNPKTNHGAMALFSKGGSMDKKMEMRHAMAMKKAGLPKKMVAEEFNEAKGMKCGGKVVKMARGGGVESKGKTRGKFV